MGLRFRKSVTLFKGVKLNFGKTGASLSFGVPGFRGTIHSSGRTTTSVGIPGTGLYYTTTDNPNRTQTSRSQSEQTYEQPTNYFNDAEYTSSNIEDDFIKPTFESNANHSMGNLANSINLTAENFRNIHKVCDEPVDWTEIFVNPEPTDEMYNKELWAYYHSVAGEILNGDIDTYLRVIQEINPLNDLLEYGSDFEFGTDNPNKIEVEFRVKSEEVFPAKSKLNQADYMNLWQDYVCSCSIRVARDMFALLPVQDVIVHAVDYINSKDKTILSVVFDRSTMNAIRFNFIDPSEAIAKFQNNMDFDIKSGFHEVKRIEL